VCTSRIDGWCGTPGIPHVGRNDGLNMNDPTHELFAALYRDLRALADRQLRRNGGALISPTTLLHEAYLNMSGRSAAFEDSARFIGYTSRVMRGLIIDLVRERRALKRGGAFHITRLPTELVGDAIADGELQQLSEALDELANRDPRLAELVDLKYFCGYTFDEIARLRNVSIRTVQRDWEKARLLLFTQLNMQMVAAPEAPRH
jgi:RNA polymerase sigma factor (TIGR02999 family)